MKKLNDIVNNMPKRFGFKINRDTASSLNDPANMVNEMVNDIIINPDKDDHIYRKCEFGFAAELRKIVDRIWFNSAKDEEIIKHFDRIKRKFMYIPEIFPTNDYSVTIVKNDIQKSPHSTTVDNLYEYLVENETNIDKTWHIINFEYTDNHYSMLAFSMKYIVFYLADDETVTDMIITEF